MAFPGAGRQHGQHHSMGMPQPQEQQYQQQYDGYQQPPGPPPNQYGGYPQQGYGGDGGYPQNIQQSPFPEPQQYNYAPPPSMGMPQPNQQQQQQYSAPSGPPPMQYGAPSSAPPPQNFGPPQYTGGQFVAHMQPVTNAHQYSDCSGRRKALCIGINYVGTSNALAGCHNDARNMAKFLCERYRFKQEDIVMLLDTPTARPVDLPTRANMTRAMQWLVRDAQPNDSLFFHYSGHGGQTEDLDGDEDDGMDETIYPVDFKQAGQIVDDEMHHYMVKSLPQGCRLTAIFDSCHSGTALDLPYIYSTQGKLKEPNLLAEAGSGVMTAATSYLRGDMGGVFRSVTGLGKKMMNGNKAEEITRQTRTSAADCISWSGCKDSQTSADTSEAGKATGAMSYAFISALTKYPQQTYIQLLNTIRDELRGKYDQKPQLSCSHELDTNLIAIF